MRGKALHNACQIILFQDHPRLCGEKAYIDNVPQINPGSPPPMRGKVCVHFRKQSANRITPAYAGKSFWRKYTVLYP